MGRPKGPVKDYIVYDNRTETVLAVGPAIECARQLGITPESFRSQVSRFRARLKGNGATENKYYDIFVIEDDEEEEK